MDNLSPELRSERMSRVRSKHTRPEVALRSLVHRLGYRFRLHAPDMPGKPDLVFRGRRKVVFMHGCFWHRHDDPSCKLARLPKSRQDFWVRKLTSNARRDEVTERALTAEGWEVLVVWECQLKERAAVAERLVAFLGER